MFKNIAEMKQKLEILKQEARSLNHESMDLEQTAAFNKKCLEMDTLSREIDKEEVEQREAMKSPNMNNEYLSGNPNRGDYSGIEYGGDPSVKIYNRSNLHELRNAFKAQDKSGIQGSPDFSKYVRGLVTGRWDNAGLEQSLVQTRALTLRSAETVEVTMSLLSFQLM